MKVNDLSPKVSSTCCITFASILLFFRPPWLVFDTFSLNITLIKPLSFSTNLNWSCDKSRCYFPPLRTNNFPVRSTRVLITASKLCVPSILCIHISFFSVIEIAFACFLNGCCLDCRSFNRLSRIC